MLRFFKKIANIRKDSLIIQIVLNVAMLSLISLAILVFISVKNRYDSFHKDKQQIRHDILSRKMDLIQNQTLTARRYIHYAKEKYHEDLIDQLKEQVNTDFRFIKYLHQSNISESKETIITRIQSAYKTEEQSKRNLFVNTLNGKALVNTSNPSWVGDNLLDLTDYRGNKLVRNEIESLENKSEALFSYQLSANDSSLFSRRITFIKKYEPLNIYLGEAIYLEDHIDNVKSKIIDLLANIRFGSEGYIFLNTKDGAGLIKDGKKVKDPVNMWNLTDPNGVKVVQEEYRASNTPGGDFIYYSWKKLNSNEVARKVSFVAGVDEFNWMVGAGTYLDEINQRISNREQELKAGLYDDYSLFAVIVILVVFSGYFILRYFVRTEQAQVNLFIDYFRKSGDSFQILDIKKFRYNEFMRMAESLNKMVMERKKIAEERERDRLLLRYMIDAIPDVIAYKNIRLRYLGCNKAFEKVFGISRDTMTNKSAKQIFPSNVVEEIRQMEKKLFETKDTVRREIWMNNRQGDKLLFDLVKSFYYDNSGNTLGVITIARDITQKEKQKAQLHEALEKASQSDQLKSAFLTNISHEIRTPVNAIRGFSSIIHEEEMSIEDVSLHLKQITSASEQLLKILENILFLSLIESESLVYFPSDVNLNEILKTAFDDVVSRHANENENNDVAYSLKLPDEAVRKNIDPFWFKSIADNVIDNAFKFTDKGSVTVEAKYAGGHFKIKVSDTGTGIAPGNEKRIYNSFYRLPENHKTAYHGTGSGLYIVKTLMNRMHGSIWYESEPGKGTVFHLDFPKDIPAELKDKTREQGMDGLLFSGNTFLLAFNNDVSYEFLRIILNRKSAEVRRAKTARETLDACNEPEVNAVIIDALMEGKGTIELVKKLKKCSSVPVFVIRSQQEPITDSEILKAGAQGILYRPLVMKNFYDVIYKAVNKSQQDSKQ